jgi:hypothetical protein
MLEETFKEWERKLRQQGRREGRREARREAEAKGMQTLFLDTLRYRFGPVPQMVRKRVRGIYSFSEFKKLIRRVMNANSLQETGLLEPDSPSESRGESPRARRGGNRGQLPQ